MDWLVQLIWYDGKFLGIEWHLWKGVGWMGNVAFTSRILVQWWATERRKAVVVPDAFWWISLSGAACLLAYSVYQRDSVFFFAYVFTFIPYGRNLVIGHRTRKTCRTCAACGVRSPASANFCPQCGHALAKGAAG
ncbi:MAG: lipid-A-disaccharide synthase N-terminal domain-containing protein [Verrucomicrobia bacterium]|nr:lipid-A-disaccharide synthase N-terminal domain-containing protein [Verrucomicrobiota bacterium]